MKKDEVKFLYIILFLVVVIAAALILIVIKIENNKVEEEKQRNISLQQQLDMIAKTKRDNPIFGESIEKEQRSNTELNVPADKKYIGKWKRVSMLINGIPENFSEAVLEINEDSFVKTTNCSISGSLSINDSKMIMSVEEDGCKEGKNNFVNNYLISPDGKKLTLLINDPQFKMIEDYERIVQK
ncbi:hypothetical protein M0R01_01170 [bacterium]|nr:hypothetical protein [bacterium]